MQCVQCGGDIFVEHLKGPAGICPSCQGAQPTYIETLESGFTATGLAEMYEALVEEAGSRLAGDSFEAGSFGRDLWSSLCGMQPQKLRPSEEEEEAMWRWLIDWHEGPSCLEELYRHINAARALQGERLVLTVGWQGVEQGCQETARHAAEQASVQTAGSRVGLSHAQLRAQVELEQQDIARAEQARHLSIEEAFEFSNEWWHSLQLTERVRSAGGAVREEPSKVLDPESKSEIDGALRAVSECNVELTVAAVQGMCMSAIRLHPLPIALSLHVVSMSSLHLWINLGARSSRPHSSWPEGRGGC